MSKLGDVDLRSLEFVIPAKGDLVEIGAERRLSGRDAAHRAVRNGAIFVPRQRCAVCDRRRADERCRSASPDASPRARGSYRPLAARRAAGRSHPRCCADVERRSLRVRRMRPQKPRRCADRASPPRSCRRASSSEPGSMPRSKSFSKPRSIGASPEPALVQGQKAERRNVSFVKRKRMAQRNRPIVERRLVDQREDLARCARDCAGTSRRSVARDRGERR